MVALQVCNAEIYQHPHHRIGEIKFKRAPFVKERHPNTDQKHKKQAPKLQMRSRYAFYTFVQPWVDEIEQHICRYKPVVVKRGWEQRTKDARAIQMNTTEKKNNQIDDRDDPYVQLKLEELDLPVLLFSLQEPRRADKEYIVTEITTVVKESQNIFFKRIWQRIDVIKPRCSRMPACRVRH